MDDEFSVVIGDGYHKTLFGEDRTDVFDVIEKYPLILGGVNEVLRKYLSYLFIREISSVDLIVKKRRLNKREKIKMGLELIEGMIKRGKLKDEEMDDFNSDDRKILYRLQNVGITKFKVSGGFPSDWYVDTAHFEIYARKEKKAIIEKIKSQVTEYSSQSYHQCKSCGEIYDTEEVFQIGYKCRKCGAEKIKDLKEHPNSQFLRDVLKRMNAEIYS